MGRPIYRKLPDGYIDYDGDEDPEEEEEVEAAIAYVEECMKWRPKWAPTLPLTCEVGFATN